jgi:hypothetical protein
MDIKLFKLFYKGIFKDSDDFHNSLKYSFRPDIISLFKGDYFKDYFAELKFSAFVILCVGTIFLEVIIANAILL